MYRQGTLLFLVLFVVTGCGKSIRDDSSLWKIDSSNLPAADISVKIDGLGPCTDNPDRTLHLNSKQPTIILAHGCFASAGRFRALSEVFAFQGQQTACFTYNDRDSMLQSSSEFVTAIQKLGRVMQNKHFTIIGHSQGGLISRKALIKEREPILNDPELDLRLVTISSPFSGIEAAAHCGSPVARVLTLGLIVPVCYAISGGKWYEITSASDFIQKPGTFIPQVSDYLKIVTDERNTCRHYDEEGHCVEDDYVFSVAEQYYPAIDKDSTLTNVQLHAGHVEIVGGRHVAPTKLIHIFQQYHIMNTTAVGRRSAFHSLLARLYETESGASR
jgi:alpha-beta hydrolase superfamily lysophospholipase